MHTKYNTYSSNACNESFIDLRSNIIFVVKTGLHNGKLLGSNCIRVISIHIPNVNEKDFAG